MPLPAPDPSMLGSGMANNAAVLEKFRMPYLQAAQQAMMNGQQFPPFEQWAAQQMQAQAQTQPSMLQRVRGLLGV